MNGNETQAALYGDGDERGPFVKVSNRELI